MRRFIVCAAILIAQYAAEPGIDRRTFVAKAIRRSPTHDDFFGSGLPMARGLRPKTKKPTPPPTTTLPPTTAAPTRAPQQQRPQQHQQARPNYAPPGYPQQQGTGAYIPQGYQYPPNYPYYAQSRPQQQQAPPPFFNPFMFGGYQGQSGQPMMVPVPVPVPVASMPGLSGIPNLMQPFAAPATTEKPRKSRKRHHYATLMPQVEQEETRSPTQEEIDTMDRNEVRRAPVRRRQQQTYYDDDYSVEETSTAATMFPTLPTMAPMKLPTLPPFTLPPSFEKLLGITTPKPKKDKRRKEKRRREYEDEEEYAPVKRREGRRMEKESRPHGRSLAVEEDRGRRDPFEDAAGFEEQKEEKESAPSVADRLMMKSFSSKKKKEETGGEEDWLVPFRK